MYYIDTITTYSAHNKKWLEVCQYVSQYERSLFNDLDSVNFFMDRLIEKVTCLNTKYPRTTRFIVRRYNTRVSCYPENNKVDGDYVFVFNFVRVKNFFGFGGSLGSSVVGEIRKEVKK